jgi:hypothetical protein
LDTLAQQSNHKNLRKKTKEQIKMKNIPKKQTWKQSNPTHEKKKK